MKNIECTYYHSIGAFKEKYFELDDCGNTFNLVDEYFRICNKDKEIISSTKEFDEAVLKIVDYESVVILMKLRFDEKYDRYDNIINSIGDNYGEYNY